MEAPETARRITVLSNCFLTFVSLFLVFGQWFTDDDPAAGSTSHLEAVFPDNEPLQVGVLVALLIFGVTLATIALHQFWNRFVATVFTLRTITLAEAYALSLIIYILLA